MCERLYQIIINKELQRIVTRSSVLRQDEHTAGHRLIFGIIQTGDRDSVCTLLLTSRQAHCRSVSRLADEGLGADIARSTEGRSCEAILHGLLVVCKG